MDLQAWVNGTARLGLWFLFNYLSIAIHEVGHLCGALLVDFKPMEIRIGHRNRRELFRTGDLRWVFGINPYGGMMIAAGKDPRNFRLRYLVYVAAGPLANVGLLFLMITFITAVDHGDFPDWWESTAAGFIMIEVIQLFWCLKPGQFWSEGRLHYTDARLMLRMLTCKKEEVTNTYRRWALTLCRFLLRRDHVDEARKVYVRATEGTSQTSREREGLWIHYLLLAGKSADAREAANEMLEGVEGEQRVEILDMLASMPVFWNDMELLPDATEWIDEAIRLDSRNITLFGTKGSILVENGNVEEGKALLERVSRETDSENDRVICEYYFALCCHLSGDVEGAKRRLEAAQKSVLHPHLGARIKARIAGTEYKDPLGGWDET